MASKLSALLALVAAPSVLAEPAGLRGAVPDLRANATEPHMLNASSSEIIEINGVEEKEDWGDAPATGEDVAHTSVGKCPFSEQVIDSSSSCASSSNVGCAGCYLYRVCHGPPACVINGYSVVPGSPLRGMEDINGANAGSWDFLFSVARGRCEAESCLLITNPVHFRSQHQMHIHYRQLNGVGLTLKTQLENALCGTSGWQPFSKCGPVCQPFSRCGPAKARLYDELPAVFSDVAKASGGGSLANVGITVWSTSACGGGRKTMVLAQTHCSIEHSISAR